MNYRATETRKSRSTADDEKPRAARGPVTCPEIHAALLSLAATRNGFEGLTGALLGAATGGAMRLMASGDQLGLDAIEDAAANAPRRAMQAKRYKDKTPLDQSALLGEMVRAHAAFPGVDCWILATTKALFGKEAEPLRRLAEQQGWGFVPLDWSELAPGCPRFAVLCALYPDITAHWPELDAVRDKLTTLAQSDGFEAAAATLRAELRAADIGFAAARSAAAAQIERVYADPAAARTIAGRSPALIAEAPPVSRASLLAAMAGWFASVQQVHVLLGLEGMGKTWGALSALRQLAAQPEGPLPVVISSDAAGEARDGLVALVAALGAIGEQAGLRLADADAFWRRRLACWAAAGEGLAPRLLILIDGLDERDPFDWQRWLAPLLTAERRDLFKLLLTCREDEWNSRIRLNSLSADRLNVTPVGRFSVEERDAYLRSRGLDREQVSDQVLEEALHPRTAFHLTRLADELGDLARVTREQLLLRDFSNRHIVKGGVLDAAGFEELVRRMATEAQRAALDQRAFRVSAGEVVEAAADISGYAQGEMRAVLSDLVSGHWFVRDPDAPSRLTFRDAALPDAVGLALASMIRRHNTAEALAEIDRFLAPWGADDLTEKVLRTCATALVTDPNVSDALCGAILERWRDKPMHGRAGQDFWRRLHIFRPTSFLDLCQRHANRGGEWLLEWGIACLWEDHKSAQPMVEARLSDWLTTIGVPRTNSSDEARSEPFLSRDREGQRARLEELERQEPGRWQARIGRDADALPQGAARIAARVLGFLPRAPFVDLFRDWALNCAAAGRIVHAREIEALLRDNDDDALEALDAIRAAATALEADGGDLKRAAAAHLLRATGATGDAAHADALLPRPRRAGRPRWTERVTTPEGVRLALGRADPLCPREVIAALWADAGDPDVELDRALDERLGEAVAALSAAEVPELFEQSGRSLSVLLRWRPNQAFALIRDYLLTGPVPAVEEGPSGRRTLRRIAMSALPFLDQVDRHALADRLDASASAEGRGRSAANALRLAHAPLADQIALLLTTPASTWPRDYRYLLNEPAGDEIAQLIGNIDFAQPSDAIQQPLILARDLARRFGTPDVERDWRAGFTHEDEAIRYQAIELARHAGGARAARALAELGPSASEAPDQLKAFDISGVLAELDDAALEPLVNRLSPETLAHIYLNRPALREAVLPRWRAWMEDCLLIDRRSRGFGSAFSHYLDRSDAYAQYWRDHPAEAASLIRDAWADARLRGNILWDHGEGPAWLLIEALAESEPELVKSVWRGAVSRSSNMWVSSTESFPAELPAGEVFDDLRAEMLVRAKLDDRLFDAVRRLEASKHQPFLISWIERNLRSDVPIEQARALTVAGFLDATDEAMALWSSVLREPPGPGWLAEVHASAAVWFGAARHARHWYRVLRDAFDEQQAVRAFAVLNRVGDARVWLFFRNESLKVEPSSWRAQWLDFFREATQALRADAAKGLKHSVLHGQRVSDILHGR